MNGHTAAAAEYSRAALDALSSLIAVIEADGTIRHANRAWSRFAAQQTGQSGSAAEGANYFEIWRKWAQDDVSQCEELASGVRSLFDRSQRELECSIRARGAPEERLLLVRGSIAEVGTAEVAVLAHQETGRGQQTAIRMAEARVRSASNAQELRALSRLGSGSSGGGAASRLSARDPEEFERLAEIYSGILEVALAQRVFKVAGNVSVRLRLLAEDLGAVNAHPRDVIDLHKHALKGRARHLMMGRIVLVEEARMALLELMGHLAAFYRARRGEETGERWSH